MLFLVNTRCRFISYPEDDPRALPEFRAPADLFLPRL
jgi:hypothetical protein